MFLGISVWRGVVWCGVCMCVFGGVCAYNGLLLGVLGHGRAQLIL